MTCDTAIIGGGAAGLFAACFLKKNGADFLLLEKNSECGKKLLVTGHGRCNITNLKTPQELKKGYHEAANFIYPAISGFAPSDCVEFINKELKIRTKTEENDRVFPVSDKASDVRDAMVRYVGADHIKTGFECVSIKPEDGVFTVSSKAGDTITCRHLILSCGGRSYPQTGSDGSGFDLAASLGHTIVSPRAALSPVKTSEEFCMPLAGVTAENTVLSLWYDGKKQAAYTGSVLFTHSGLSGPATLELSREIPAEITGETYILANFAAGLNEQEFASAVNSNPNTKIVNLVAEYVPKSLASAVCGDDDIYCKDVRSAYRKDIFRKLTEMRFDITEKPDIRTAYCTRGGVKLSELDRRSYESKIIPNLYIIGENTDVDGISGGYNLAFASSSAYFAVKSVLS